jgi:hypothetical protein
LPLVLSITALVVAVLGATPVGHAVVSVVPPFAKKAHYADRAGTASAVNGIKAARKPRPRFLVPLDARGKLPASVAPAGPVGPQGKMGPQGAKGNAGAKGDTGPPGISGYEFAHGSSVSDSTSEKSALVTCPAGKKAVGGGAEVSLSSEPVALRLSYPFDGATSGWFGRAYETTPTSDSWFLLVYAVCVDVSA